MSEVANDTAIPSKATTDARDSSFRRSYLVFCYNFACRWANNDFNSTINQMPAANWAPFPTRRREGKGMGSNNELARLIMSIVGTSAASDAAISSKVATACYLGNGLNSVMDCFTRSSFAMTGRRVRFPSDSAGFVRAKHFPDK